MWRKKDWAHLFVQTDGVEDWWMHEVHIKFLYDLAMLCPVGLQNVLEVGSYRGNSASAWVQAMCDGHGLNLTCCDTKIQDELRKTVAKAPRPVKLLEMPGTDVIGRGWDVVFIDSDHRIGVTSREMGLCLLHEVPTIIMHDTFVDWVDWCNGPFWARQALECHPLYLTVSDGKGDPDLRRRWGLTLATRDRWIYKIAQELMENL